MRAPLLVLVLAACGSGNKSAATAKPAPAPAPAPEPAPASEPQSGAFAPLTGTSDSAPVYEEDPPPGAGKEPLGEVKTQEGGAFAVLTGTGEVSSSFDSKISVVPKVRFGAITGGRGLDKKNVKRAMSRNHAKTTYCYEKQLLAKPDIRGTVTATFTIGVDGHVTTAAADGVDPTVASCIVTMLQNLTFAKPRTKAPVDVTLPISFEPTGG